MPRDRLSRLSCFFRRLISGFTSECATEILRLFRLVEQVPEMPVQFEGGRWMLRFAAVCLGLSLVVLLPGSVQADESAPAEEVPAVTGLPAAKAKAALQGAGLRGEIQLGQVGPLERQRAHRLSAEIRRPARSSPAVRRCSSNSTPSAPHP